MRVPETLGSTLIVLVIEGQGTENRGDDYRGNLQQKGESQNQMHSDSGTS